MKKTKKVALVAVTLMFIGSLVCMATYCVEASVMMRTGGKPGPKDTEHTGSAKGAEGLDAQKFLKAFNSEAAKSLTGSAKKGKLSGQAGVASAVFQAYVGQERAVQKSKEMAQTAQLFVDAVNKGNVKVLPDNQMPAGKDMSYHYDKGVVKLLVASSIMDEASEVFNSKSPNIRGKVPAKFRKKAGHEVGELTLILHSNVEEPEAHQERVISSISGEANVMMGEDATRANGNPYRVVDEGGVAIAGNMIAVVSKPDYEAKVFASYFDVVITADMLAETKINPAADVVVFASDGLAQEVGKAMDKMNAFFVPLRAAEKGQEGARTRIATVVSAKHVAAHLYRLDPGNADDVDVMLNILKKAGYKQMTKATLTKNWGNLVDSASKNRTAALTVFTYPVEIMQDDNWMHRLEGQDEAGENA